LLDNAWSNYYAYKQSNNQTLHEYLKDYQSLVQVLEHYSTAIGAEGLYLASVKDKPMVEAPEDLSTVEYHKRAVAAAK
jgi:hypothetical protein